MKKLVFFFVGIWIFAPGILWASIPNTMSTKFDNIEHDLLQIKAQVNSIEKNLGEKQSVFNAKLKELNELEIQSQNLKKNLAEQRLLIKAEFTKLKEEIHLLLVQQVDENYNQEMALNQKILTTHIKNQMQVLATLLERSKMLDQEWTELNNRHDDCKKSVEILNQLVTKLETNKSNLLNHLNRQKQTWEQQEQIKIRDTLEQEQKQMVTTDQALNQAALTQEQFNSPCQNCHKFAISDSGVNLFYQGATPIVAPKEGKISYIGTLSTYGTVILIDHDHNLKSVILGQFVVTAQAGQTVRAGELIAQANNPKEGLQKQAIYYEVRKDEKPQDTLKLLKF